MLAPNTLLQNRYLIVQAIGQGGMGAVYQAKDQRLHSIVALKETLFGDERMRRAFEHEAELLANLHHPALPNVTDHFTEENGQFLVMQFIGGDDLSAMLQRRGAAFPPAQVQGWGDQLLDVLDYLHTQQPPIIHRDIKPQNIKLTPRGQIILLDFGLAKGTPLQISRPSSNSSIYGYTPSYAPLEQIQGTGTDPRSDLYALAATLHHLMTGVAPPEALTRATSVLGGQPDPLRPAHETNPQVPAAVAAVLYNAMAQNPQQRPPTAAAMRDALRDAMQSAGGSLPATVIQRQPTWTKHEQNTLLRPGPLSLPPSQPSPSSQPPLSQQPPPLRSQLPIDSSAGGVGQEQPTSTQRVHGAETGGFEATPTVLSLQSFGGGAKRRRGRPIAVLLTALVVTLVGVAGGLYKFFGPDRAGSSPPFQSMKITRLATNGRATDAIVSPDGKYVVYVVEEAGRQGLWGKQIATSSNVQIVAPAEIEYQGLTFSRDGNYVYYVASEGNSPAGALYQVPALGGAVRKLVANVNGAVTLAPDGRRMAFISRQPSGEQALMIANADGNVERKLATRKYPDFFREPAWSPDGEVIACAAGSYAGGFYMNVIEVRVADGAEKPISARKWWSVGRVAWHSDGNGLVITSRDQASGTPKQISYLSYPAGEVRRISNDLSDYGGASLTADSSLLVTVQSEQVSTIWIAPRAAEPSLRTARAGPVVDVSRAKQITFGKYDQVSGLCWASGDKIVYTSNASGNWDIWVMEADGANQKPLTVNAQNNLDPSISPDGRYIVFGSNRAGSFNIWRMDIDGVNQKQLTNGGSEWWPSVSPDGRWVVYTSISSGKWTLWKVPAEGGDAVRLTDEFSGWPSVSPDGKLIACSYWGGQGAFQPKLATIPFDGGPPVKIFDIPNYELQLVHWVDDGRALTYHDDRSGVSNIWSQPVDGGPPKQLTDFKSEKIFAYDWSPDGRQVASARGVSTSGVVLISAVK